MNDPRPEICDLGPCVEEKGHLGECVPPWPATVHVANEMVDLMQRCARCGETLTDYRNAAVEEGGGRIRGWGEGTRVAISGTNPKMFYVIADSTPLEIHETECGATPS